MTALVASIQAFIVLDNLRTCVVSLKPSPKDGLRAACWSDLTCRSRVPLEEAGYPHGYDILEKSITGNPVDIRLLHRGERS